MRRNYVCFMSLVSIFLFRFTTQTPLGILGGSSQLFRSKRIHGLPVVRGAQDFCVVCTSLHVVNALLLVSAIISSCCGHGKKKGKRE